MVTAIAVTITQSTQFGLDTSDSLLVAVYRNMNVAIYCSSHGLGHLTRCLEVGEGLIALGHSGASVLVSEC